MAVFRVEKTKDFTMDISPERQQIRLKERDPSSFERFQTIWIPREEHYFTACQIRSYCDLVVWGG